MYRFKDYFERGSVFFHNNLFPGKKKISSLMIYVTDLCDSGCKHCLIWAKRPVMHIPKERVFEIISNNHCVSQKTTIGLQGGEFMLHPDALEILEWLSVNHPRFDLLSNCLKPD
ncbi:MAG: radical SAM protein, partial [Chitinophagaceae bacterium]